MAETTVPSVIDSKTVLTHMNATNKDEALQALATALSNAGYLSDTESYIHDVYQREAEGSTGIGNYIAIPHGKSDGVSRIGVAIGILDHEIDWETIDDHGVKVIILFAVGSDTEGAKEHLKLLSLFARKLGRDSVIDALLKADNAEDVKAAFNN